MRQVDQRVIERIERACEEANGGTGGTIFGRFHHICVAARHAGFWTDYHLDGILDIGFIMESPDKEAMIQIRKTGSYIYIPGATYCFRSAFLKPQDYPEAVYIHKDKKGNFKVVPHEFAKEFAS